MYFRPHRLTLSLLFLLLAGAVSAHATIVFGTLTTTPDPPPAGDPFVLRIQMVDPSTAPVEDAFVLAELSREGEPAGSVRLDETEEPGVYQASLEVDAAGEYLVTLRDQTYRQEEAVARVTLPVGGESRLEPIEFIFPPTAVGGSLTTWLIWLIGVPVVAGLVVTLLVLRSGPQQQAGSKEKQ